MRQGQEAGNKGCLVKSTTPREQLELNATGALWKPAWNAFQSIPVKGQGT